MIFRVVFWLCTFKRRFLYILCSELLLFVKETTGMNFSPLQNCFSTLSLDIYFFKFWWRMNKTIPWRRSLGLAQSLGLDKIFTEKRYMYAFYVYYFYTSIPPIYRKMSIKTKFLLRKFKVSTKRRNAGTWNAGTWNTGTWNAGTWNAGTWNAD